MGVDVGTAGVVEGVDTGCVEVDGVEIGIDCEVDTGTPELKTGEEGVLLVGGVVGLVDGVAELVGKHTDIPWV